MIFITARHEKTVQVNDLTTYFISTDLSKDSDPLTLLEIEPEAAYGYIDITGDDGFSWAYDVNGEKTITVRATAGLDVVSKSFTVEILNETEDRLFSGDADLVSCEDDIVNYVREGRRTFLDKHREAQRIIMDTMDKMKLTDVNGDKLTKFAVSDLEEVQSWSKYLTLGIIFEGISNQVDDIFSDKAKKYMDKAENESGRAYIRLDRDGDDAVEGNPTILDLTSARMVRR